MLVSDACGTVHVRFRDVVQLISSLASQQISSFVQLSASGTTRFWHNIRVFAANPQARVYIPSADDDISDDEAEHDDDAPVVCYSLDFSSLFR